MKTDEFITLLATGDSGVPQGAVTHRLGMGLGLGTTVCVVLMLTLLGVHDDVVERLEMPMFWVKLGFGASLAAGGMVAVRRLARPGVRLGAVAGALLLPVLAVWGLAAISLLDAAPAERSALLLGETASLCPLLIAGLATPVFAGALWAISGLAPTRLRLAGAAAGLLAGAVAATVYAVHCPELAAPFIGLWYLLGIAIPTALGAAIGPLLLRW